MDVRPAPRWPPRWSTWYTAPFSTLIPRLAYVLNRVDGERAQAHEAVTRQRQQLDGIIETAMDAVVVVDDRQQVVMFNPAAEAMFQRRAAEVIGRPVTGVRADGEVFPIEAWISKLEVDGQRL